MIARNAEPGSTLSYLLRIPLGDAIILKATDTCPSTGKVMVRYRDARARCDV